MKKKDCHNYSENDMCGNNEKHSNSNDLSTFNSNFVRRILFYFLGLFHEFV